MMTKRQYLLQHLLHLSAMLKNTTDPRQRQNMEQAIVFYANELKALEEERRHPPYMQ